MGRGLGADQRTLLVAIALAEEEFEDALIFSDDDGPWIVVSQLRLVETDEPERFPTNQTATRADRRFKRIRRAAWRRTLQALVQRDLLEAKMAPISLRHLGQYSYFERRRNTWLARLTDPAWDLVLDHDFFDLAGSITQRLDRAIYFNNSELRQELQYESLCKSFPRKPAPRKRTAPPPVAGSPTPETPKIDLSPEETVDALCTEGFSPEQAKTALRAWHRAERRRYREDFGVNAPPLDKCVLHREDLDVLRQQIRNGS